MLAWLRRNAQDRLRAVDLYGAVVAAARQPAFFTHHGVQDTPEGRAALVILMAFPVLERLQKQSPRARRFARRVTEAYVTDVDDCLREMGVGDMAVPKKVKKAAHALAERCRAYGHAVSGENPAPRLAAQIAETVPGLETRPGDAMALAHVALDLRRALADLSEEDLLQGRVSFPAPPHEHTQKESVVETHR